MAAPKKGRGSSGGQGRPGRALALILIAMVALTGGMFLSGHTTPRLGIDLAGGTSITLKAKSQPGKPDAINPTNMDTAVSIIERRVNGLGVSEAEVQTQGRDNIIVNIPKGTNSKQAREQVGTTAQLYFRPVLTVTAGQATPTDTASPSASGSAKPSASPSDKETASGSKATPSAACHHPGPRGHRRPQEGHVAQPQHQRLRDAEGVREPFGLGRPGHRRAPEAVRRSGLLHQGRPCEGRCQREAHRHHDRVQLRG